MKKRKKITAGGISNLAQKLKIKCAEEDKKGKKLTGSHVISLLFLLFKANDFYCDGKSNNIQRDIINGQLIFKSRNRISKPHVAITVSF